MEIKIVVITLGRRYSLWKGRLLGCWNDLFLDLEHA